MSLLRLLLVMPLAFTLPACNKDQPSGVPELPASTAPAAQPAAAPPPAPAPAAAPAVSALEAAPPPLDGDIPPFATTGFPDCDDYVELYRRCLNSRLGGDERKAKASELQASVRSILGNIARGVDPARVAKQCLKSRRLTAQKLADLGCTI